MGDCFKRQQNDGLIIQVLCHQVKTRKMRERYSMLLAMKLMLIKMRQTQQGMHTMAIIQVLYFKVLRPF